MFHILKMAVMVSHQLKQLSGQNEYALAIELIFLAFNEYPGCADCLTVASMLNMSVAN